MGFSFHDENSMIEAAESLCFVPATSTGSAGNNDDQERRDDNEDHLELFGIELNDNSDIQIVDRSA